MGKLKIIIIVCGIIVVGTIGTVTIISNNKNSKTNNINSKTQNQILTTTPSKASTSESVTKNESETENKASVNSAASNNKAIESSSTQSQESTNQVTATNTTSNTSNSTSSNSTNNATTSKTSNNNSNISENNNNVSSQTQSSNNSQKQSIATFSMATINKNCDLYGGPNKNYGTSLKLAKGQTVFILNNTSSYTIPKGWTFVRTAMGAGYLPSSECTVSNNIEYVIKVATKLCKLYSNTNINSATNLEVSSQVLVPMNESSSSKWTFVIAPKTLNTFESGYLPSNILTSTSQVAQQA